MTAPGIYTYTPEMGEKKPHCDIEARLTHYGKHYLLDTPLALHMRGITLIKTYTEKDFTNGKQNHRIGWQAYRATEKAFLALKQTFSISMEEHLD